MNKLFAQWMVLKEKIHTTYRNVSMVGDFYVNSREIWYVNLGVNIGYEEDGKWYKGIECRRPVIVIKKIGILYLVVPMTSAPKDNKFYHIVSESNVVYYQDAAKREKSGIILSQIRVIDKSRFIHKIAEVTKQEFFIIKEKLKTLLF